MFILKNEASIHDRTVIKGDEMLATIVDDII
jgi:hypothetical protein